MIALSMFLFIRPSYSQGESFQIAYIVSVDSAEINYINIQVYFTPQGSTPDINASSLDYAKWFVEKDNRVIRQGDLKFVSDNHFESGQISLKWLGSGTYYAWIEVSYKGNVTSTESEKDDTSHKVLRSAPLEDFLHIATIIIAIVIAVIIIAIIISRRGLRQEQKRLKASMIEKPIEIIDINKSNIKKIEKKQQKKQKGRTQISQDLIFSVPQWEEEDLEKLNDETSETKEGSKDLEAKIIYSLHCPSCNNWFEIDEYVETDCPNCQTKLLLALYCDKCDKWFDVPKMGEYKCPKCSNPLKFQK